MSAIPRISIVIANPGAGRLLDRAIGSLVDQAGPDLDLIMVDVGGTQIARAIIERYRPWFSHVLSAPGEDLTRTLNRGFAVATGDIMGWLGADDILIPGALQRLGRIFAARDDYDWITGRQIRIGDHGEVMLNAPPRALSWLRFLAGDYRWIQQEATFWRRSLWERAGASLDDSLRLATDGELWFRFFRFAPLHAVDTEIGAFRQRADRRWGSAAAYHAEMATLIARERDLAPQTCRQRYPGIFASQPVSRRRHEAAGLAGVTTEDTGIARLSSIDPTLRNPVHGRSLAAELADMPSDLNGFRGRHAGQRCVVMGNGPSLNRMDLDVFTGETVFAANSVFLLFDRIGWRPRYYSCVDTRVLPDIAPEIEAMHRENPEMQMFFPTGLIVWDGSGRRLNTRNIVRPAPNRYFFREEGYSLGNLPGSAFSLDCADHLCRPHTVIVTLMQLAAYMGFADICLIGCDTSYTVPASVRQEGPEVGDGTAERLLLTSTEDDDPNHFDARYFGRDRKWHAPKVQDMIFHYRQAAQVLNKAGVRVWNATVGGNLEVFPRIDYREAMRRPQT